MSDEYIDLKDLETHKKKEKVKTFFGNIASGAGKVGHALGSTASKVAEGVKDYEAKAPERRERRIQELKQEEKKLVSIRQEQVLRERVQKLRSNATPRFDNPFGSPIFMRDPLNVPTKKTKTKAGSRRKEHKKGSFFDSW